MKPKSSYDFEYYVLSENIVANFSIAQIFIVANESSRPLSYETLINRFFVFIN